MADMDAVFKALLDAFLPQVLSVFFPELAGQLLVESYESLPTEWYAGLLRSDHRTSDRLYRTATSDEDLKIIAVLVEVEARAATRTGRRLIHYQSLAEVHEQIPVMPMAINVRGGQVGIGTARYVHAVFGSTTTIEYPCVNLSRLRAEGYLGREEPLAYGLAAWMDPGGWSRPRLKLECLMGIARTTGDEWQRTVLGASVGMALPLSSSEQEEFDRLVNEEGFKMAGVITTSWHEAGRAEGVRDLALRCLRRKFGALPSDVEARVRSIADEEELDQLVERLMDGASLEDLGLPEPAES